MASIRFDHFDKSVVQKFIDAKSISEDQDEEELINDETWYHHAFNACVFDEDKMMTHILDCYAALCAFQQYRRRKQQSNKLNAKTQQAKNKAFKIAMSLMSRGMTNDGAKLPRGRSNLSKFMTMFPGDSEQTDDHSWMPLHWAILALETNEGKVHGLSEEDVKLIYAIDPQALQRFCKGITADDDDEQHYTPAHFLCMQPVTLITMSLLRYFSMCNLQALISSTYDDLSVLHAVCQFGEPTEELLQHLLQLDSSQVSMSSWEDFTPLQCLCQNDWCNESLMNCVLQFDSSAAVVGGAIQTCLNLNDCPRTLEKVDFLLKANPEVAQHHFDASQQNLLHLAVAACPQGKTLSKLRFDIMKRILALHPDAVREVNDDGELPLHIAAKRSSVDVMEFLLGLYPESAKIITVGKSENLLHLAASHYNSPNVVTIVRYLCSRYPEFVHQRNKDGNTPLLVALERLNYNLSAAMLLCEIGGGHALVRVPTVHPTATTHEQNGWLPLHYLISGRWRSCGYSFSEVSSFFRMMLRWYPEAAGIEAGNGRMKKTPYELAVDGKLEPYYRRLLLRAVPDLNPAELHRLNFAERRMAMFMAFRAITTGITPLLMARLRFENKDLVKHVVSFL